MRRTGKEAARGCAKVRRGRGLESRHAGKGVARRIEKEAGLCKCGGGIR